MSVSANHHAPNTAAARPRRRASSPRRAGAARNENGGTGEDPRNLVNSLSKGLRVLEAFSAERNEMTLSEVARAAGIDPGTAFRMLNTLVMLGYVARVPGSKRFRLTLKVVDLGFHAIGRSDLRELARPILRSLVDEISEAASLGVLDGGDVLYVERVRAGLTRLGVDIRIGTLIPAASGIIGHAILAFLPAADRERILETPPRRSDAALQSLSKAELVRTLERCPAARLRVAGFAVRQRAARARGAGARWRRLSGGRDQPRGAGGADVDGRIPRPLARAGARGGEADRARGAGERNHLDRGLTRARKPNRMTTEAQLPAGTAPR